MGGKLGSDGFGFEEGCSVNRSEETGSVTGIEDTTAGGVGDFAWGVALVELATAVADVLFGSVLTC